MSAAEFTTQRFVAHPSPNGNRTLSLLGVRPASTQAQAESRMPQKFPERRDRVEHEIEQVLTPGVFVSDRANFSFVSDLERMAGRIGALTRTQPSRAVKLYETLLAGCYEKPHELDDSGGSFGQFVGDLFCAWIKARQSARVDPEQTVVKLLAWMDDDPFGFCSRLEEDAVKVLNRAGLAALGRDHHGKTSETADRPL